MATKLAIFASGNGTNFKAISDEISNGHLDAEIMLLVVDKKDAPVIQYAKNLNIDIYYLDYKLFENKFLAEEKLIDKLNEFNIELIILAGFMRIITDTLLNSYENKIINIHPSLLPNFPGRHGIIDAFNAGVKETGVTIHYVDSGVDSGQVIEQKTVVITKTDTLTSLENKIHAVEHKLYPKVINELITNNKEQKNETSTFERI